MALRTTAFALMPGGIRSNGRLARVLSAVAAGTFSATELQESRVRHWAAFSTEHVSRKQGLFLWEEKFYSKALKPRSKLLVVGAGSGRDVLCFLRADHDIVALDESAPALEELSRRLAQAERTAVIHAGSIVDFQSPDRFDAVIFSWLAYILIPTRADRIRALQQAARVLAAQGGVILISYKPGSGSRALGRLSRAVARLVGGEPPEDFEEFRFSGPPGAARLYHSRFFAPAEIEEEAAQAGLHVIFHDHGVPGWDHPGCLSLRT